MPTWVWVVIGLVMLPFAIPGVVMVVGMVVAVVAAVVGVFAAIGDSIMRWVHRGKKEGSM